MATTSLRAQNGRYTVGGTAEIDSLGFLGWWEMKKFATSTDDVTLVLSRKYHLRPDLVAYDAYGRSDLMWFVLQYNAIVDVTEEFVAGASIILPTQRRVLTELVASSS